MNRACFILAVLFFSPFAGFAQSPSLIAHSTYSYDGPVLLSLDSIQYYYSGGRGGNLSAALKYDSAVTYEADTSSGIYSPYSRLLQTFDGSNNILSLTMQFISAGSSSWVNDQQQLYTYNSGNAMTSETVKTWSGSAWQNIQYDTLIFNASNQVIKELVQDGAGTGWVNATQSFYTYNAGGGMDTILTMEWNTTSSAWDSSDLYSYFYNSAALDTEVLTQNWVGAALTSYFREYTTYNAAGYTTRYRDQTWDTSANTWVNGFMSMNGYDGANNITVDSFWLWDTSASVWQIEGAQQYDNYTGADYEYLYTYQWSVPGAVFLREQRDSVSYNGYNERTADINTLVSGTSVTGATTTMDFYYYGPAPSAVPQVSQGAQSLSVYPVPAKDVLHVAVVWASPQPCVILITDMQGRIVRQLGEPQSLTCNTTIPVNTLPAGNYMLSVTGNDGTATRKITVAR